MSLDAPPRSPTSSAVPADGEDENDPRMPYLPSGMTVMRGQVVDMVEQRHSDYHSLSQSGGLLYTSQQHQETWIEPKTLPELPFPIDPAIIRGGKGMSGPHSRREEQHGSIVEKPAAQDGGGNHPIDAFNDGSIVVHGESDARGEKQRHQCPPINLEPPSRPPKVATPARRQTRAMARAANAEPLLVGLDDRGRPSGKILSNTRSGSGDANRKGSSKKTQQGEKARKLGVPPGASPGTSRSGISRAAIHPRSITLKRNRSVIETPTASPTSPRTTSTDEWSTIVVAGTVAESTESEETDSKRRKPYLGSFPGGRSWVEGEVRGHWCRGDSDCGDCRESMHDGAFGLYEDGDEEMTDDDDGGEEFEFIDSP